MPFEVTIVSAHRTPQRMFEYASTAHTRGLRVIIAGAGMARVVYFFSCECTCACVYVYACEFVHVRVRVFVFVCV